MGIVKISEELHETAKIVARAMNRSINAQAEYWMRIGKIIEANPTITYADVLKILMNQAATSETLYADKDT